MKFSWFTLLCWCLLYSNSSAIQIYTSFFHNFFHYGLSQEIEYSSLCYTVGGPHCLSILNVTVCIYQLQAPSPLISLPPLPLGSHRSVVSVCVILLELTIILFVSLFLCFALSCLNMVILRGAAWSPGSRPLSDCLLPRLELPQGRRYFIPRALFFQKLIHLLSYWQLYS